MFYNLFLDKIYANNHDTISLAPQINVDKISSFHFTDRKQVKGKSRDFIDKHYMESKILYCVYI